MKSLMFWLGLACAASCMPAMADSITGGSTSGGNSITGTTITSNNSGAVTASGTFLNRSVINGGRSNAIGVSAIGASVLVSIVHDGGNPDAATSDSIAVGSINTTNSGAVSATGIFHGARIDGGTGNGMSVSAAGTSVTISIVHR